MQICLRVTCCVFREGFGGNQRVTRNTQHNFGIIIFLELPYINFRKAGAASELTDDIIICYSCKEAIGPAILHAGSRLAEIAESN